MPAAYGRRRAALAVVAGLALLGLTAPDAAATARTSGAATGTPATATRTATATATGTTAGFTPAQLRMQRMLSTRVRNPIFGSNVSGFVVDHASGSAVWGRYSATGMVPASTTKVLTAVAALRVLGPDSRVTTRVRRGGRTTTTQVVYLVGAGDQALSSAGIDQLAAQTIRALGPLGGRRVTVGVDDSLFPAPRLSPGWSSSYYPHNVAPVRALIRDQREVYDTAIDAGTYLRSRLSARGVAVGSVVRAKAPAGSTVLAAKLSPPVRTMVGTMLRRSDNDYAEGLMRLAAVRLGYAGTWQNGTAVVRWVLSKLGVPLTNVRLYDGSGLSRWNRIPARTLTAALRASVWPSRPDLNAIYASDALPLSGVTGTLSSDFGRYTTWPSSCARGDIRAKTGTLRDVVTLAGLATAVDGRKYFFAFMVNGPSSTLSLKRAVDGLAATVTGCW